MIETIAELGGQLSQTVLFACHRFSLRLLVATKDNARRVHVVFSTMVLHQRKEVNTKVFAFLNERMRGDIQGNIMDFSLVFRFHRVFSSGSVGFLNLI